MTARIIRFFIAWSFLLVSSVCLAHEETVHIRVSDQDAFARLDETVREALQGSPTSVDVLIDSGVYYYHDRHLDFQGLSADGKRLSIRGNGAVLYPDVEPVHAGPFDVNACVYTDSCGILSPVYAPEPMRKARFLVRVVSRRHKICRLKISEELGDYAVQNGYIYLTQWFRGRTYKITAVKGRYVYFHADDLNWVRLLYNVNLDFTFSLDWPRYRLINCHEPAGAGSQKQAVASTFLSFSHGQMDSLSLSGIRFIGSRHDSMDENNAVVLIDSARVPTRIRDCRFEHIRNDCIRIRHAEAVSVTGCSFDHCYRYCFFAEEGVSDIIVADNDAVSCGLCGDNVFVFRCCADGFRICGNTVSDFGYSAISTGLHYSIVKTSPVRGLIADNEIFQTADYFRDAPMNLLMDSGAIYVTTQNDSLVIRDNYIHDINGPTYNRGIFADDGASHLRIVGNRIERIQNYNAIDIDPRSSWKLKWRRHRKIPISEINVGNSISGNTVSGRIRMPAQ